MRLPSLAKDRDFAGCCLQQAFQNFNGRGLSGAVGAEQAETFPGMDVKVQPAHSFDFAIVGLAQVAAFDNGRHWSILLKAAESFLCELCVLCAYTFLPFCGKMAPLEIQSNSHATGALRLHLNALPLSTVCVSPEFHSEL